MRLKATQVFTPGSFPEHTYVERKEIGLEKSLRDSLDVPGIIVSLSGPSKSGKTVLIEKVVGRDNLITITGAAMNKPEEVWERVLDWINAPAQKITATATTGTVGASAEVGAGGGLFGIIKGESKAGASAESARREETARTEKRRGLTQVLEEIGNSDYVVLLDDFHYMSPKAQSEVARQLKEAARVGIRICTASVPHRADDVVRSNADLRGRVRAVDLGYWDDVALARIAELGFPRLGIMIDDDSVQTFVRESAGSPQLMQTICLACCNHLDVREEREGMTKHTLDTAARRTVLETCAGFSDYRSLVDVLDSGPKTRGQDRTEYTFADGSKGDVYRCVLRALAADPPRLTWDYAELLERVKALCPHDAPTGSSVVGSCLHMSRLALEKFPSNRAIDWDEAKQVLDIADPYFLFYLRWSGRLAE